MFDLSKAVTLERLNELAEAGRGAKVLLPLDAALSELPSAHLTAEDAQRIRQGAAVRGGEENWADGAPVKLYDHAGSLLAVGVYDAARRSLRPRVLLVAEK